MDITAANLDIIYRDAQNTWQSALTATPVIHPQIATTVPMGARQVTNAFLDRIPMMRKWLGERVITNAIAHSRTITAELYEQTVSLDKFDIKDDNLGLWSYTVQMQAEAGAKHPDDLIYTFLSTQAATVLGYDGVPVYSTAHPILGGVDGPAPAGAPATQSNLLTSTALTYQNYIDARAQMRSWKGADGAPMMVTPDTLMVGPELEGTAKLILESDFLAQFASTSTSNASQTNTYKNTAKILVNPWLSGMPNNWYLLDTSGPIKPYAFYQLDPVTMTALVNPNDPNVFLNHKFIWGIECRDAACETVWWKSLAATSEATYYPA